MITARELPQARMSLNVAAEIAVTDAGEKRFLSSKSDADMSHRGLQSQSLCVQ